jgi:hypothetical protein
MSVVWNGRSVVQTKPVAAPVSSGVVARVRQRLFPGNTNAVKPEVVEPYPPLTRSITVNASIAEFLLINRLKARSQNRAQAAEMLERAAHIVFVTCKHWFTSGDGQSPGRRTPL